MIKRKNLTAFVSARLRLLVFGVALALLGFAPSGAPAGQDDLFARAKVQKFFSPLPVPEFRLQDLDGKWVSIRDFQGKVVLLNLWATWCNFCVKERPGLEKLYRDYKDRGFVVVAVSIDKQGAEIVRPFVEKHKLTFPHLLDPAMEVSNGIFGLWGTPTNYLISRGWKIVGGAVGYRDWESSEARRLIESLLAEAGVKDGSPE